MHVMRRFVTGGLLLFALALAVVSAPAAYAAAAAPASGTTQTLTPPPLPNATCQTTGSGIFCHGDLTFSDTNRPTGISCGSFDVLVSDTGTATYELRYNSAGLALEARILMNSQGTFINSVTGKTIGNDSHFSLTFDFARPGDPSTVTVTLTGAAGIATGQGIGLVAHDVGKVVFDPSHNILFEGGPHNSIDNPPAFVQAICAALS
jgi:opacity protein-like surface antigen